MSNITVISRKKIIAHAKSWLGVPYFLGGNSRDAIDCSNLITQIFKGALGIRFTPRSDWLYLYEAPPVPTPRLLPGDIVYFCRQPRPIGRLVTHCGINIGNGKIIHASHAGVVITPLSSFEETIIDSRDPEYISTWIQEILPPA